MIFLYSIRSKKLLFIPLVGAIFLSGLPFMLSASGWSGLVVLPVNFPDLLFLSAQSLLIFGYLRHGLKPEESPLKLERWIQTVYPLAYIFMIGSGGLLTAWGWTGSLSPG